MRGLAIWGTPLGGYGGSAAPFDPLTLSPYLWLDASDITTLFQDAGGTTPVASDGDPVGLWLDKSGNGRHYSQATSGRRPTYKTNVQNGKPGILFDGVDDFLSNATGITAAAANLGTGLATMRPNHPTNSLGIFGSEVPTNTGSYYYLISNLKTTIFNANLATFSGQGTGAMTQGVSHQTMGSFDGTNFVFRKDSAADGGGASPGVFVGTAQNLGALTIGGAPAEAFMQHIHEVFYVTYVFTAAQWVPWEARQVSYWGVA